MDSEDQNIVLKMEVDEEMETEATASGTAEAITGTSAEFTSSTQTADIEMTDSSSQCDLGKVVMKDADMNHGPITRDFEIQTVSAVLQDKCTQTQDAVAVNLAYEMIKAVSTKGILDLLNDKQKLTVANRITGSMYRQNKKRKVTGSENQPPTPSTSFHEKSTILYTRESEEAKIFKCQGIRGQDERGECGFECSTITSLIEHRKDCHYYAPMQSHWKVDTKELRSKDKVKCLKVKAFSRDLCGKELLSQDLLVKHFTETVHYNEVKILSQYCVTCATSFVNDYECVKHGLEKMDSCGFME